MGLNRKVLKVATLRTSATWMPLGFLKAQAVVSFRAWTRPSTDWTVLDKPA